MGIEKPLYELLDRQSKRISRDIERITAKNELCKEFIEDVTRWAEKNDNQIALSIKSALMSRPTLNIRDLYFQDELEQVNSRKKRFSPDLVSSPLRR